MKEILRFTSIICCLLLCSCEQTDTRLKTSDGRYTEYTGHPNLYHTSRFFDVIKLNDTTFLCIPNISEKDIVTIKINNHEIYERKD